MNEDRQIVGPVSVIIVINYYDSKHERRITCSTMRNGEIHKDKDPDKKQSFVQL